MAYVVKMKPVKNSSRQQNKDCLQLDPALTAFCTYSYRIKCKYLEIAQCIYTAVFHRFSNLGIFQSTLCFMAPSVMPTVAQQPVGIRTERDVASVSLPEGSCSPGARQPFS